MRKLPWGAFGLLAATLGALNVFAGCGSEGSEIDPGTIDGGDGSASAQDGSGGDGSSPNDGAINDGESDASINDATVCKAVGQSCTKSGDCCSDTCLKAAGAASGQCGVNADASGTCTPAGGNCTNNTECCTNSCVGGSCSATQCKPDTPVAAACTTNAECCSGKCDVGGTNKCVAVAGGTCRTEGNPCTTNGDCCSKQCSGAGLCANVSFCAQVGDVCANDFECCGGNCNINVGETYGRCANLAGAPCQPAGSLCTGSGCDNACCSLSCGPLGTSGVNICQPPGGCKPQNEVCAASGDCCGGPGQPRGLEPNGATPAPIECKVPAGETLGRCEGAQCLRPGTVCKAPVGACGGTSNNCCSPLTPAGDKVDNGFCNSNPEQCCSRDALGIPRCRAVAFDCGDGGAVPPGITCATSADCCGKPCVDNKCEGSCVPKGGECTTTADCCAGTPCVQAPGSTSGVCGGTTLPDGGVSDAGGTSDGGGNLPDGGTCALYGQTCAVSGDCCSGVPCTTGRCRYP